ncbi:hypothetical protein GWK47_046972 [Chionoecetes opilio]|uniref:Uncharacterized protein n=1 Tax=Chionoecetes opilio TaxID=41210 RepID=A0A8J5CGM4_CHIOP|nr:hypothetical protein GWK47_046972 [Chionoecetes opilio]
MEVPFSWLKWYDGRGTYTFQLPTTMHHFTVKHYRKLRVVFDGLQCGPSHEGQINISARDKNCDGHTVTYNWKKPNSHWNDGGFPPITRTKQTLIHLDMPRSNTNRRIVMVLATLMDCASTPAHKVTFLTWTISRSLCDEEFLTLSTEPP